jgi:hypoxanthine phosphoribosyltransferase
LDYILAKNNLPENMQKKFINAEELLLDSYRLSMLIFESGFRPDFIVGLWRGGSPVGIAVQDCLDYLGIKTDHISLRTSYRGLQSYQQMISDSDNIRVHGTQYLLDNLNAENRLLIIDDVYSSGLSVQAVINRLRQKLRLNMPEDVRIAVPWYKPSKNKTGRVPDYFVYQTDDWLVLPYELNGLSEEEIAEHKPLVKALSDSVKM